MPAWESAMPDVGWNERTWGEDRNWSDGGEGGAQHGVTARPNGSAHSILDCTAGCRQVGSSKLRRASVGGLGL